MSKEVAVKSNDNLPAELADELAELKGTVNVPTGGRIKPTRSGDFLVPGYGEVESPIPVVIVDFSSRNEYYPNDWDPKNIQPPLCAAVGRGSNDDLVADEGGQIQADNCAECPFNQWETAKQGRGKACNNTKLVAVLPAGIDINAVKPEKMLTVSVSSSGIKGFDALITQFATKMRNVPRAFQVEMATKPAGSGWTVTFSDPQPLPEDVVNYMHGRKQEASDLVFAAPVFEFEDA